MAATERRMTRPTTVSSFDFRRPGAFSRDVVRSLAAVHELFGRRLSTGWGAALRAAVQIEEVAVDQATYGDFLASMPTPNALAAIRLDPLPGQIILEMSVEMALMLVDRLLGSAASVIGTPSTARRLTDVESVLLRQLLNGAVDGVTEALSSIVEVDGVLESVEYNPQLVQVAAPTDRVVLLTYRVVMSQGFRGDGLVTLCYPVQTLTPIVDRVLKARHAGGEDGEHAGPAIDPVWAARVASVGVELTARLNETAVPAADLAALEIGDVLRLDHRIDQPLTLRVGDTEISRGHVGRRGRRLAVQLAEGLPRPISSAIHERSFADTLLTDPSVPRDPVAGAAPHVPASPTAGGQL